MSDSYSKIDNVGNRFWYKEGTDILHREDGPAVEHVDGSKYWYKEGYHHREDGPAVESITGLKYWYKEGLLHRLDGPAIDRNDESKEYYYEGKFIIASSDEEYKRLLKLKAFW